MVSTYEVITLMLSFGLMLIALLAYIDNRNNKQKLSTAKAVHVK